MLSLPHDALNLTRLDTIVHYGTHLDAPNHFIADGPSIDQIPLARLWGPGVVWRIDASEDGVIEVDDLESAIPTVRRGDIVVLDTGWSAYIDDDRYERHPSLSEPGARWLVERGAKLVAFDTQTPDTPIYRRPPSFNFPVHHILLGSGVLIVENVTNHRALANQRIDVVLLPLAIAGSDGSPIRILARPAGSENEGSPHD